MFCKGKLALYVVHIVYLLFVLQLCFADGNSKSEEVIGAGETPRSDAPATESEASTADASTSSDARQQTQASLEHRYQKLLRQKRLYHRDAVKTIVSLDDYEKQHKMITLLLDKLFKVLTDSQVKLMSMGFSPGDPFPTNETVQDAYSNVVENTAFLGDLVLRLPDVVHDVMKRKKDWTLLAQWGVGFCEMANIFEENDARLLDLMSQEFGFKEKSENYINPYKEDYLKTNTKLDEDLAEYTKKVLKKQQKKKQKEKRKGPRLSGGRTEL